CIARPDELAWMLDSFRPAHLRDVHQTFDAGLQLDESTVIGNARNFPGDARSDGEAFFDCFRRIGQKLLVTQRDALELAIKAKHLYLNRIANVENFRRIL